jgi:autotransporter-associated beta strand protein
MHRALKAVDSFSSPRKNPRRALCLAAGAAASLGAFTQRSMASTYVWVAPGNGNFSGAANWQGNSVPPSGTGTSLTFNVPTLVSSTATNDVTSPFVVNSLVFNVASPFIQTGPPAFLGFTVQGSSAANVIQLDGPSPTISMNGVGTANLSATGANLVLADPTPGETTTFGGAGPGNLVVASIISESGGPHSLTISGGAPLPALRMITLSNFNNAFSGGLILDGGTVQTGGFGPSTFGAPGSTLTVKPSGGTIAQSQNLSSGCTLGAIQLNGPLHIIGSGSQMPLTDGSSSATLLSGTGDLIMNATGSVTLYSNSTGYTGTVTIDRTEMPNFTGNVGTLTLASLGGSTTLQGALVNVPAFNVRAGGTLSLNNNVGNSQQNGNRIGDTTPVNLRSANLSLTGPATAGAAGFNPTNLQENMGALHGAGMAVVTVQPGTGLGVTTTLNPTSLNRDEHGTFLFRGAGLGDSSLVLRPRITFGTPPTGDLVGGGGIDGSATISILPYAVGGASGPGDLGTSLVTYGADGVRPLKSAIATATFTPEYYQNLDGTFAPMAAYTPPAPPNDKTSNVELFGATTVSADTTMNSLVLATSGTSGSVNGTGSLYVTSGAIIANTNSTPGTTISNDVYFGHLDQSNTFVATEGFISTPGGGGGLTITGALHGNQGLTKFGIQTSQANALSLRGNNSTLTGPLTINSGVIIFNSGAALPGTGTIFTNGALQQSVGNATGLIYGDATATTSLPPLTLGRPIVTNSGLLQIVNFAHNPTLSQNFGGTLVLDQVISGAGGLSLGTGVVGADIWISGISNTYTGPTRVSGTVHIYGDGAFGNGGAIDLGGGSVTLEGDWTTSRNVNFSTAGTIDTQAHNATLNGPVTGFTNVSSGALTPQAVAGFTKLGTGTLTLTSPASNLAGPVNVNAGTLIVNGAIGPSTTSAFAVAVSSGATLGGSGTINRQVIINIGATLSPGNSPGTITTGNLTLSGNLNAEVNGTSAADLVNVYGTVTLGASSVLNLSVTGTPSGPVIIVQNDGADAVSGTFATVNGLPAGATINYAFSGTDSLGRVGDGNDIAIIFPQACYANCDGSTTAPVLNVGDFTCFLQKFAAGDPYANCDQSTTPPVLNVGDFTCFLQKYAAGCP